MKYYVILNPKSGAALNLGLTGEGLLKAFEDAKLEAFIDANDDDLGVKIERAVASDAETIVSAGGDGTATAVAEHLVGTKKCLGVLPLGTANLLARDLGVPLTLETAITALAAMKLTEIDAGEVNGRVFLHKVVVGVIPAIAAARERVRGESAWKLLGFARYFVRRLASARRTAVSIASRDTNDRIERIHAIAVANNAYDQGWGKLFSRSSLNRGILTLYVLNRLTFSDAFRLGWEMIAGTWQADAAVKIETVRSVTLNSKRSRLCVMIDGEVGTMETPLRFRVRPAALRVLSPLADTEPSNPEKVSSEDHSPLGPALRAS
jgi:diacylglycerol kinase family enzyme